MARDLAERMLERASLYEILEDNGISEAGVLRILIDKGLIDPNRTYSDPRRLYYGDDSD